ncbi:MAG: GNAT family N-acetyltransferase [Candidatus Lokiarchaeota archaeon]|nr:GNAT family N-acetyltransferase [Candidatus Lokiarchaeota archaeon]MBD3201520.1 GNAT family N-acetyltransferase [Candidatus Lokiarchaeota archaeon]
MNTTKKVQLSTDKIIDLPKTRLDEAIAVACRAFFDYPTTTLMLPDQDERKEKIKYGFIPTFRYGIKYGIVHATSPNLEGIAIWLPPEKVHISAWSMLRLGGFRAFRKSGLKVMKRGMPLFRYMGPAHERNAPEKHWYLQTLAVDPIYQKKGYGGILIQKMCELIDEQKLPVYLETNTEENVGFYQKYGFEVVEHLILPETDVPFWCMLRKAEK